jgi:hypothetical protein
MASSTRQARSLEQRGQRLESRQIQHRHAAARAARGNSPQRGISRTEPEGADPDHHLWRNGRLWWVAFTVIHDGWRQERVRVSLQTDDVEVARERRDGLFRLVEAAGECEISLRFVGRRGVSGESDRAAAEPVAVRG